MSAERRKNRSHEKYRAIDLQFEALRNQGGFQHIALADSDGMLLGASGDQRACEELGFRAASKCQEIPEAALSKWRVDGDVAVRPIDRQGSRLYLGVAGAKIEADRMRAIAESVERIFDGHGH